MATVSPKLTLPFTLGAGALLGQGNAPELWCLYSTDDASVATPTWNDATAKVRSFSVSRGRESELAEIDAATATITLDNRTRTFDPAFNASIRPMNRWWLREQFSGETQDLFVGYADAYDQQWPGSGFDAVATASCTDEFKVLALDALPTTNPPRDSYADLVNFDIPHGYFQFDELTVNDRHARARLVSVVTSRTVPVPVLGNDGFLITSGGSYTTPAGAIVGSSGTGLQCSGLTKLTKAVSSGDPGSPTSAAEYTVECWAKITSLPGIDDDFIVGPTTTGPLSTYSMFIRPSGTVLAQWRDTTGLRSVESGVLSQNVWHHLVWTVEAGTLFLYVDGAQAASDTAWTGTFNQTLSPDPGALELLDADQIALDEVAFYRHSLSATRVLAHYQAGTQRGFPSQLPNVRANGILDAAESQAPRLIQVATNTMVPEFMRGQDPLGELRQAVKAESVDAMFFTARDGTLTFLADGHRSSSPYNTVQATFDDDGSDLPYQDLDLDFSESFLTNEWNVTRRDGTTQSASDTTSISKYFKRPQSLTDLPITLDADATAIAAAMLAKYKDPITRITSLTLTTDVPDVAEAVFRRDIGDRIRVLRTPPGGGARIDQTLFIQKIEASGANDGKPWLIRWGVSPL